ncbi:aldo/keto reductase [Frondihabitans australicus]|uniref:Aryl-alcohol dehydrogenase-like predicted oxidoreductase n=1 Tax=Frondihabitans australicus TaxID=386892 RepID=A0A495IMM7_9MICO|nr:aldo/keto reductase [Frondihabitans australicus]RKR76426.1 aryl-alcohol dehydrogenase-like predicted oxidoreductase [Frondihabitans australicus]
MPQSPAAPRTLGSGGPVVSAVGLGSWAMGGPHWRRGEPIGWGVVDDDESVAAIHAALDAGITFFDTADVYGCGHSERVLGGVLGPLGDRVVVATKFGYTYDEETRESPGTDASPAYIRQACEASLGRLGRDAIDLYQFHLGQHEIADVDDVIETLEELVAEGKICAFGWSTDDTARAEYIARSPHCAAIQQAFNILSGNAATLEVCERNGLASIVRSPLGMGLLTGSMSRETTFSAMDVRRSWDFDGEQGDRLGRLERIRGVLTEDGRTLAQGALGWLLARSPACIPIPGMRTVAQVVDDAGVLAAGALSPTQMDTIESLLSAPAA